MRILGVVLIVLGIIMIIFTGFNYQTKEKVIDVGPVEVNKTEEHRVGWPTYAGGLIIIGGIVALVAAGRKK